VVTAPRSPWQNPFVERLIGTLRRECLDHVIVWNEGSLRLTLKLFLAYYHEWRPHLSLDKMRRSHGRYNRQPAARSSKCRMSAGSITITNAAPPDHRSPRRQTGTGPGAGSLNSRRPADGTTYLSVARPLFSRCPSDGAARFRTLELPAGDPDDGSDRLKSADGVSGRDRRLASPTHHRLRFGGAAPSLRRLSRAAMVFGALAPPT
jgi:hypothetical protein